MYCIFCSGGVIDGDPTKRVFLSVMPYINRSMFVDADNIKIYLYVLHFHNDMHSYAYIFNTCTFV